MLSTKRHIGLGIPIDVAGLADGKSLVYNEVAGTLEYQTVSGGEGGAHTLGGSTHNADTLENLNSKISDAALDSASASRTPTVHTHVEIDITDLTHDPNAHAHVETDIADLAHIPNPHTHVEADITDLTHTPPGGGGVEIKSDEAIDGSVTFNSAFSAIPHITLTCLINDTSKLYSAHVLTKSTSGFTYAAHSQDGRTTGDVTSSVPVQWIATDMGNP